MHRSIDKGRLFGACFVSNHGSAHMIKMQVRQDQIGDVFGFVSGGIQATHERIRPVQFVMPKELFTLLAPNACIDQYDFIGRFNEQAAHGPIAEIVLVGGVQLVPNAFGYGSEHGPAIKLKITG
jgi:hypothetical protein